MHGSATPFVLGEGAAVSPLFAAAGVGLLALALGYALWARGRGASPGHSVPRARTGGSTADQAPAVEVWADASAPKVLVVNKSGRPVHDLRAFVALGRRRAHCVGWIRTLPPTGEEAARVALTAEGRETWIKWRDKDRSGGRVAVECTFRDDTGQYWRRTPAGELKPLAGGRAAVQLGAR